MISGLDISIKNKKVNWDSIEPSQIPFAFIQATEGADRSNPYYEHNYSLSKQRGLLIGSYHWFNPQQNPDQQLANYLKISKFQENDLPPVVCLDQLKPIVAEFENRIKKFIEKIDKKTGKKPIIYTSETFWNSYLSNAHWACDYVLWIDKPGDIWPSQVFPWAGWTFWQYHYQARIPGVDGMAGLNWFNGDLEELRNLS